MLCFWCANKLIEKYIHNIHFDEIQFPPISMSSTTNCLNSVTIFNFIINLFRTHFASIWSLSRLKYSMIIVWYRLPYRFLICFCMCERRKLKYVRPFRKIINQIVACYSFENLLFVYNLLEPLNRSDLISLLSAQ